MKKHEWGLILAGICAGAVNGLLGAGGGMVLVPLLSLLTNLDEEASFPTSVSMIAPVCIISLLITWQPGSIPWNVALPYLLSSAVGGIAAGFLAPKVPVIWLHRILGLLILWGGIRYLW